MNSPPRIILWVCLAVCLVCLLTALAGATLALRDQRWYLMAFEVVVIVSSFLGVLLGAGVLRNGPAISLLCTGGVIAAAAVLSEPSLVARFIQGGGAAPQPLGGFDVTMWILLRVACGGLLVVLSAITVLLRRPRQSVPYLFRGILAGVPVLAVLVALVLPATRGMMANLNPMVMIIGVIFGFFVMGLLTTISGHCLIRAFEVGVLPPPDQKPSVGAPIKN